MFILTRWLSLLLAVDGLYLRNGPSVGLAVSAQQVNPYNYTIINGQIFTPGLAIVDAPQPNTPLGGGITAPFPCKSFAHQRKQISSKSRSTLAMTEL
jgi:hypothetical protein